MILFVISFNSITTVQHPLLYLLSTFAFATWLPSMPACAYAFDTSMNSASCLGDGRYVFVVMHVLVHDMHWKWSRRQGQNSRVFLVHGMKAGMVCKTIPAYLALSAIWLANDRVVFPWLDFGTCVCWLITVYG